MKRILIIIAMLLIASIGAAAAAEGAEPYNASASTGTGFWGFASTDLPITVMSIDEANNTTADQMAIGNWYGFSTETILPGSFVFLTKIGSFSDLSKVSLATASPHGSAYASNYSVVSDSNGTNTLYFDNEGFDRISIGGVTMDRVTNTYLIRNGTSFVVLPDYAGPENFFVTLVDIDPSYKVEFPTKFAGNFTVTSSLPVAVVSEDFRYDQMQPLTWYVLETEFTPGQRVIGFVIEVDKPSAAGGLPNFSPLNIELTSPGNVSIAGNFHAFRSENGTSLLNVVSYNFPGISLLKGDGTEQKIYLLNGTALPLGAYSSSDKTIVMLIKFI